MEIKRLQTARFLARRDARERLRLLARERSELLQEYPELQDLDREVGQHQVNNIYRRSQLSPLKAHEWAPTDRGTSLVSRYETHKKH